MSLYPQKFGSNPLYPQSTDFEVVVVSDSVGMGVISYRKFEKGELVAELAGDIIHDIRQHSLQIDSKSHLYDTYFSGFFMHSCSPNVFLDMKNLKVYAVKPIKSNDYLLMDYAQTEEYLFKQFPCGCGAHNCRGWITGNKESSDSAETDFQRHARYGKVAV